MANLRSKAPVATCVGCGCDDEHVCKGGCWWLRVDRQEGRGVCSACASCVGAWDRGDHRIRARAARRTVTPPVTDGRGRHGKQPRGDKHYRWNRGRLKTEAGYAKLRVGLDHPLADPNGYAYEHVLIWVAAGRPRPAADEVLCFVNGDKSDARLGNLKLKKRRVLLAQNNVSIGQDALGRFVAAGARERR